MNKFNLKQKWDKPSKSLPIIFIGAGGIIKNAHIPAYKNLASILPIVLLISFQKNLIRGLTLGAVK